MKMNAPFAFALSMYKSQNSRSDKYILTWFQDIFILIDVAINVAYGPPFKWRKDKIISYLKGMDCSPGPL